MLKDSEPRCNNSKCVGRKKCARYMAYKNDDIIARNPITFSGNRKKICTSYKEYIK